jgi:hypothetical protein
MSTVLQFSRATKKQLHLRMALAGPPGSGKTYSALNVAKFLPGPIAVIDTESRSASKYADLFEFDVLELDHHAPQAYVAAIHAAAAAGYQTLIIDSLSHAWMGNDGALEQVDRIAANAKNSFQAWGQVTPAHNEMLRAILAAPMHVIATMRSKMAYVVEPNERGQQVPRKVGLQPVQRDGVEFEFDVVGDLNQDNILTVTKSRCPAMSGRSFRRPGREVAEELTKWLTRGEIVHVNEPAPAPPAPARFVTAGPSAAELRESVAAFMTPKEQDLVAKYTKRFVESKTLSELRSIRQMCVREAGGPAASPAFQRWYIEAARQAEGGIGAVEGPGTAKAPPPPPPPPAAGAQMPTQRAVSR